MFVHSSPKERITTAVVVCAFFGIAGLVGARALRKPTPITFKPVDTRDAGAGTSSGQVAVDVEGAVKKPGLYMFSSDARVDDAIKTAGGALVNADLASLNRAAKLVDGSQLKIPTKSEAKSMVVAEATQPAQKTRNRRRMPGLSGSLPSGDIASSPYAAVPVTPKIVPVSGDPQSYAAEPSEPPAETDVSKKTKEGAPHHKGKKAPPVELISLNRATLVELESIPGVGEITAQRIIDYRTEHGAFQSIDELGDIKGIGTKKLEKMRPYVSL